MFSAWDFSSWIASVVVVLFMLSLLIGFGALVSALMARIWGEERDLAATPPLSSTAKELPTRKAA
jgi:Na+-transporting methylmalonyl-CoA/oxaloacetate decarboxylase gamma subunit